MDNCYNYSCKFIKYLLNIDKGHQIKASAHSFKHFTSPPLLKLAFSLYAPITSDGYHAWFHLNAASPIESYTEQVFIVGFESSHGKETSLQVHRLNCSVNSQISLYKS